LTFLTEFSILDRLRGLSGYPLHGSKNLLWIFSRFALGIADRAAGIHTLSRRDD
jgi:hypothetical protein